MTTVVASALGGIGLDIRQACATEIAEHQVNVDIEGRHTRRGIHDAYSWRNARSSQSATVIVNGPLRL
jgi:hypothetical protein